MLHPHVTSCKRVLKYGERHDLTMDCRQHDEATVERLQEPYMAPQRRNCTRWCLCINTCITRRCRSLKNDASRAVQERYVALQQGIAQLQPAWEAGMKLFAQNAALPPL